MKHLKIFENFNSDQKIHTIWNTWEIAGIELAQDLVYHWDINDDELYRVICLVSIRVRGLKITQHLDQRFSYKGLYPEIQKSYNIKPDNI